jgi:hypothetical protein
MVRIQVEKRGVESLDTDLRDRDSGQIGIFVVMTAAGE